MRISLMRHVPTIWRRLLVPGEIELSKVHRIFQAAMGWDDHHMHRFEIGDHSYVGLDDELDDDELDDDEIEEDSVLLSEVVEQPMRFAYCYDFGDDWRHEVVVESIEVVPSVLKYAACIDGQRACPPEDCGGVPGFGEFLEAMADPGHDAHDHYAGWIGGTFDPEEFSVAMVNARLQKLR
jgi:hypothetical protein